jgi:hypothetical protein
LAALLFACAAPLSVSAAPLTDAQALDLLKKEEEHSNAKGDMRIITDVQVEHAGSPGYVAQMLTLRRDAKNEFLILFTKPKTEAGKGYLALGTNLWYYDASVGRWDRRTDRDRIGGTNARRQDLAARRDSELYTVKDERDETLGKVPCRVLRLTAKPESEVAYRSMLYWIDPATYAIKQIQTFSASNKLLQTVKIPKTVKVHDPTTNTDFYFSDALHIYDEVEKGFSTHMILRGIDTRPLPEQTFTKAWLESKAR